MADEELKSAEDSNQSQKSYIKTSAGKKGSRKKRSDIYNVEKRQKNSHEKDNSITDPLTLQSRCDLPLNRDGYLYRLAEPDPLAMDETFRPEDYTTKPIPSKYYRGKNEDKVSLSLSDKAQQLKLHDEFTVSGSKGYSMIRASHGATIGNYYFEIEVLELPPESGLRVGWSQKYASLQAPCGYDKLSYGWRSAFGTRFHESIGNTYSEGFEGGDILGLFIHLPHHPKQHLLPSFKNYTLVKFKNNFYFEERYLLANIMKKLEVLPRSEIRFFKNGIDQGTAFTDLYSGTYFPTISIYKEAKVRVNFGPTFAHPPSQFIFTPISTRKHETDVERMLMDIMYLSSISTQM